MTNGYAFSCRENSFNLTLQKDISTNDKSRLSGKYEMNSTQTCTVSRNGDLIHKVWLEDKGNLANV